MQSEQDAVFSEGGLLIVFLGYFLFIYKKPPNQDEVTRSFLEANPDYLKSYLDEKGTEFTEDYVTNYLSSDYHGQEILQSAIDDYIEKNGYEIVTTYMGEHPEQFER